MMGIPLGHDLGLSGPDEDRPRSESALGEGVAQNMERHILLKTCFYLAEVEPFEISLRQADVNLGVKDLLTIRIS
jgi:hypothetical protein